MIYQSIRFMKKNISFIVAHPDDETIGCGGTILKKIKEGHNINLLILSNGISARSLKKKDLIIRKKNFEKVIKNYKIKNYKILDFPDNQFDTIPLLKLIKVIENFIIKNKSSEVFTHYYDELNIDHKITSKAVITACRPKPNSFINKLFFFEVLSSTNWNFNGNTFKPNYFEDISKFTKKKIEILKLYKNEIPKGNHTRSLKNIIRLSEIRGSSVGIKNAEAYILYREINK